MTPFYDTCLCLVTSETLELHLEPNTCCLIQNTSIQTRGMDEPSCEIKTTTLVPTTAGPGSFVKQQCIVLLVAVLRISPDDKDLLAMATDISTFKLANDGYHCGVVPCSPLYSYLLAFPGWGEVKTWTEILSRNKSMYYKDGAIHDTFFESLHFVFIEHIGIVFCKIYKKARGRFNTFLSYSGANTLCCGGMPLKSNSSKEFERFFRIIEEAPPCSTLVQKLVDVGHHDSIDGFKNSLLNIVP